MHLSPSREQAVPINMLQEWMKKHLCMPFSINPIPNGNPTELGGSNEENYKALIRLLTEKNIVSCCSSEAGAELRR